MDAITSDAFGARFLEVGDRKRAWHLKGNLVLPAEKMTLTEGCKSIRADQQFKVIELYANVDGQMIPTGQHGIARLPQIRDGVEISPFKVLEACKEGWTPVDPLWLCEQFDPATKYFPLETMGSLRDDEIFFATLKQPAFDVRVNCKDDPHDGFVYIIDFHVPNTAAIIGSGSTRIVCLNTLNQAIAGASIKLPIPHNNNIHLIAAEMAQAITRLGSTQQALRDAYQNMANTAIDMPTVRELYNAAFPDMKTPRVVATLNELGNAKNGGALVAEAAGSSEAVKEYRDTAEKAYVTRNNQMAYLRETAEISLANMADNQGLGVNVYTALQSVLETVEHRAEYKRGDVQLDMIDGGRSQQISRAVKFAQALCAN